MEDEHDLKMDLGCLLDRERKAHFHTASEAVRLTLAEVEKLPGLLDLVSAGGGKPQPGGPELQDIG